MTGSLRHILLVNVFFAPETYGGATIVAEEVARYLKRTHGIRISAISAIRREDLAPYAITRAETEGMVNHMINLPPDRSYSEQYANPQVAERVAALARRLAPDLAHVHCIQEIGADCIAALKGAGLPVVLSVHDFWWLCERQFMLRPDGTYCAQNPIQIDACRGCVDDLTRFRARDAALRAAACHADLVTYPSHFAKDLSDASGFAEGKGVVWENGVQLPGPDFVQRQGTRRSQDPRVTFGFVGGPSQIKGWPLLRAAFTGPGPTGFRGLLVDGSLDGSWWRNIPIDRLRGDWHVHPRFDRAGMDAFYAEIDVLFFLSQWKETYGLTVREALARGIRVIQTDSGGTMEHGATDGVGVIPIGADASRLKVAVERVLATPTAHPRPHPVNDIAAQAEAFLRLTAPLIPPLDARGAA